MKKLTALVIVLFSLITLVATADGSFLKLSFSSDVEDNVKKGDLVEVRVNYSEIDDTGLSSTELFFTFSDGLEFREASASGLPEGWSLWDPSMENDKLKIAIVDDSVVTAGRDDFEVKLVFEVKTDSFTSEHITLSEYYVYDFDINERTDVELDAKDLRFFANVPDTNVENLGASLRINNTPALRFGLSAENLPEGAVLGFVAIKGESDNITHDTLGALVYEVSPLGQVFATSPIEISSASDKYTFRPFVLFCLEDGASFYMYFDSLTRSAEDVALAELESETDDEKIELLKAFCVGT